MKIKYNIALGCYVCHYKDEIICLGSQTYTEAKEEALLFIENYL